MGTIVHRRDALAIFGVIVAVDRFVDSAGAEEVAQAGSKTSAPPASPGMAIEPAAHVNGDYQAVYQEGYGRAFLTLGFSEEFLLQMFSEATDSLTITATAKAVFLRARSGNAQRQIMLGSTGPAEVFGATISDRHAQFVQPNRLVISFTAPNGKGVEAVHLLPDGYVTVLSIEGEPQLKPMRIWKRVEQPSRKSPQLFPL